MLKSNIFKKPFLATFVELPPAPPLVSWNGFQLWNPFCFSVENSQVKVSFFSMPFNVSPVFLFSLFFCKPSIAAVVIVTGKPRECLRIENSDHFTKVVLKMY